MPARGPITSRGPLILLCLAAVAAIAIATDTAVDFTKRRDGIQYALGAGDSTMLESKLGGVGDAPLVRITSPETPG